MKRQIESYWNPLRYINRYARNADEYVTELEITLLPTGYVEKIEVVGTSGNVGLDFEARQAVLQGGPYLNPPKEISDFDGKIHIGPWRFIVSLR
jgi:TonB family protein